MTFLALIETKRDGESLKAKQIHGIITDCTAGHIPDYQMAAMLMAIYFRGLNTAEATALTLAMRDSGDDLKFPKHKCPLAHPERPLRSLKSSANPTPPPHAPILNSRLEFACAALIVSTGRRRWNGPQVRKTRF